MAITPYSPADYSETADSALSSSDQGPQKALRASSSQKKTSDIFQNAFVLNLQNVGLFTLDMYHKVLLVNREYVQLDGFFSYHEKYGTFRLDWALIQKSLLPIDPLAKTAPQKQQYVTFYGMLKLKMAKVELGPFLLYHPVTRLWEQNVIRISGEVLHFSDLLSEEIDDDLMDKLFECKKSEQLEKINALSPNLELLPKLGKRALAILGKHLPHVDVLQLFSPGIPVPERFLEPEVLEEEGLPFFPDYFPLDDVDFQAL